jgi:hypothetical protein
MKPPSISLPPWVPQGVRKLIQEAVKAELPPEHRSIIERLATDKRMQFVWSEFLRRDRRSGQFVHPAVAFKGKRFPSIDDRQHSAVGEVFHFVFTAARDKMMVTKLEEVLRNKEHLLENANRLLMLANDLELAQSRGMLGVADPQSRKIANRDIVALRHVAGWLEGLTRASRRPDDPLIVKKLRGDPIVKGVQILTAMKLKELFGNRLDGTAATLASVAVGVKSSARASRSALTKGKSPKEAGLTRR